MATTPNTPSKPNNVPPPAPKPTQGGPTQGSVDPKQNPPDPSSSNPNVSSPNAMTITAAPPLPAEKPAPSHEQKPVMEAADAEQEAGKKAIDETKQRLAAEQEAGAAAVARYAALRPAPPKPRQPDDEVHPA